MEIDSADIRQKLLSGSTFPGLTPTSFISGWVVLETRCDTPLDVAAVYTAEAAVRESQPGLPVEVERVPGTFIPC
jgi:hypothetical protein